MSFFDEGDEPTRTSTRPRQPRPRQSPAGSARARSGGSGPGGGDAVRNRRLVAGGLLLVVVLIIFLLFSTWRSSRRENALKNYNRDVAAVVADSDEQVGKPFFELLNSGSSDATDLQGQANQLRQVAAQDARRAKGFNVPGDLERAQDYLLLVLNLRAEAIAKIAEALPGALADGADNRQTADAAVNRIAGQMRAFDASDVVYSQRVAPYIQTALDDAGVTGQEIAQSAFLPDPNWLTADAVAGALNAQRAAGGRGADPEPLPGLHGHGLVSVSVGDTTLQPGTAVNHLPQGEIPTFAVKIQNQGDNPEEDVVVRVTVSGSGKPLTAKKTVNETTSKQEADVAVALTATPPRGQPVKITVRVDKVPGEENTENNEQDYTAIFDE